MEEKSIKRYDRTHTNVILNASKTYRGKAKFLKDTGAEINSIRDDTLEAGVRIDESERTRLQGITEEVVITLGKIELEIEGRKTTFDVVGKEFNLEEDGIFFQLLPVADVDMVKRGRSEATATSLSKQKHPKKKGRRGRKKTGRTE